MQELEKRHRDLIADIKNRVCEITKGEIGMIVYLRDASYNDYSRGGSHNIITVSCIFINEEGNLCADLFRSGPGGFMECLYGNIVESIGTKAIEIINSALVEGRWYLAENPRDDSSGKNDKKKVARKKFHLPFRFSCMFKGV